MLSVDPDNPPTCNIVVSKEGEAEVICGQPAAQLITLVDPSETSKVLAVVLVCSYHDEVLEGGKSLIAVSENGEERIGIQYRSDNKGDNKLVEE